MTPLVVLLIILMVYFLLNAARAYKHKSVDVLLAETLAFVATTTLLVWLLVPGPK